MRFLRPSNEAEMIAEFLRQEYASSERYGAHIQACLDEADVDAAIIMSPDVSDVAQNGARLRVLCRYRGYGSGQPSFFTDFPTEGVDWWWVALTPDELLDSRYIRYDFWHQLSGGTRSPREAAVRIAHGSDSENESGDSFRENVLAFAGSMRAGLRVPPLILVSADGGTTRVVLEGHTRLTAYALAPECIPAEGEALLGVSPAIAHWDEY